MFSLKPPKEFVPGNQPAEAWVRWEQTFTNYCLAADLQSKPVAQQRAILLHIIGEEGVKVYNTLRFTETENNLTIKVILDGISSYYKPYQNETYLRHQFFTAVQTEGQSVDDFITNLKTKSKDCEFGDLEDSLIKHRLICGIISDVVRETLLKERNLTLNSAIDICRAAELSKEQAKAMRSEEIAKAGAVIKGNPAKQKNKSKKFKCGKCGTEHGPRSCPAWGATCHKCKKANHYAKCCKNNQAEIKGIVAITYYFVYEAFLSILHRYRVI